MSQFEGRFFLTDPFGEILFRIRKIVQSELPQTPSIQHELISFAPASLLRHRDTGECFSNKAWTVQIPMLVVQFRDSDPANRGKNPRFTNHGTPLLALLWANSPENRYLGSLLEHFSVPWYLVDRDGPITWSTKAVRDRLSTLHNQAKTAPLISSPQFEVAKELAAMENIVSELSSHDSSDRAVVQQEVSMSSVIGFEGDVTPPIINSGSFDFVVFSDIFSGSDESRIRGSKWTPVLAIEYDGKSNHAKAKQKESDQRKNEICRLAGLTLLRISYKHLGKDSGRENRDILLQERELNSRILASTFFHSLAFPKTKRRRERIFRSVYDSTLQKTSDEREATQSVLDWLQEASDEAYYDHLMTEHQLSLLVSEDISIGLEQDAEGLFYGIIKDKESGKNRWRSPSLRLELKGSNFDGEKLAKNILLDWIWEEELKRHGLDSDAAPLRA